MPADALVESASALSAALADNPDALTDHERAELTQLRDALSAALEKKEVAPELTGIVDRALATLEGSHPDLTSALGRLAETLSELGI
ncbi:MAG: DUF4404 family protein [Myxococcales bacterium]|nr:DUF4404 family protein [Myxococcales bacterium]